MAVPITELKCGESGTLAGLDGDSAMVQRLLAMGFHPGQRVERRERAPFAGPVKVDGVSAVVGLREQDAAVLDVERHER